MALPLLLIPIGEAAVSLLVRMGVSRWVGWSTLQTLLASITIKFSTMSAWFSAQMLDRGAFWTLVIDKIAEWLGVDFGELSDRIEQYQGKVGDALYSLASDFICRVINETVQRNFNVTINVTQVYPLNDPIVLENLIFELGKIAAVKINDKFGTSLISIYPVEQLQTGIKNQIFAELQSGKRKFFDSDDIQSLIEGLNKVRDDYFVGDGVARGGILIADVESISEELAYRRANGRARSRKYAQTHKRVSHAWEPK